MFKEKIYPYLLVVSQMSCLIFLLASGPLLATGYAGILIESTGVFIGLLAIYQMGIGNFNVTPINKENGHLVNTGIYKFVRHPMYFAQLLALLPLVVDYYSFARLSAMLILLITLLLKINYEESHLVKHFDGYADYMKHSKKMIPYIY
jgi:protein-S-isoprenylcysteine O-methyltransferase Ste14